MPEPTKRSQMDDRRPNYRDLQDNLRDLGKQLEAAESLNTRYRDALKYYADSDTFSWPGNHIAREALAPDAGTESCSSDALRAEVDGPEFSQ